MRFLHALYSIGIDVSSARPNETADGTVCVRMGLIEIPDLDQLSGLIEAEAVRRASAEALAVVLAEVGAKS